MIQYLHPEGEVASFGVWSSNTSTTMVLLLFARDRDRGGTGKNRFGKSQNPRPEFVSDQD